MIEKVTWETSNLCVTKAVIKQLVFIYCLVKRFLHPFVRWIVSAPHHEWQNCATLHCASRDYQLALIILIVSNYSNPYPVWYICQAYHSFPVKQAVSVEVWVAPCVLVWCVGRPGGRAGGRAGVCAGSPVQWGCVQWAEVPCHLPWRSCAAY